ncbi:alpha-L-rhamnosidase [Arthrobacter castelli]|uniref:alpha-L-rhamnosidase n=1 Tax=Arthrobacter castelli TaxID=271431 RepID=UPI000410D7B8|nr:alpha-L-rhamnosidase [Arthrobacter castelli]
MAERTPPPLERAELICPTEDTGWAPEFVRIFDVEEQCGKVVSAQLAATARGIYIARLNDKPVTESVLNPGWTSYEWRLQYQVFDVASLVSPGRNELTVTVGNGWWRGELGFEGADVNYGDEIGLMLSLRIEYQDGTVTEIATDDSWLVTDSTVAANSIYDGEDVVMSHGKGVPRTVRCQTVDRSILVEQAGPPVVRHEILKPVRVWQSPAGKTLVDFGQNLVGWIRFSARGQRGDVITLRHAEVLEYDELGTRPLRGAEATDTLVLGEGVSHFEPRFTFHGFRYAEVSGWPGELSVDSLEAVVIHSQMRRTGHFKSSNEKLNQLIDNVVWSQKGNFLDIPTDCPQRDERLGWTGDIAVFAPTASFLYDVADFLHKWLLDLAEETRANNNIVPIVVPDILKYAQFRRGFTPFEGLAATAIWGDAAVWVPEALWYAYGDVERLAEQYPGMQMHIRSVERMLDRNSLWTAGFQFGDWLDPDAPPEKPGAAKADSGVVATACLYRSATFCAEAAGILGKRDDQAHYERLAQRVKEAFNDNYVQKDGVITSDCTTVYALAITFGILPEQCIPAAAERLVKLVRDNDYRVSTGFAGTPYITWALSESGYPADAYNLLLEESCPSWMYPVTMGATTIWERWDSMLPDGAINPGEMTSFNHYAFGAIADWVYKVMAGIRPAAPGYSKIRIEPVPGEGVDWVDASLQTPHGHVRSSWHKATGHTDFIVEIPHGTEAHCVLPNGEVHDVVGGVHTFAA